MTRRLKAYAVVLFLITSCFGLVAPFSVGAQEDLIIEHGPRSSKMVALTFDACPTNLPEEFDTNVVDVLLRESVPATLFLSGRWVERHPDTAKFLARNPLFEIAAHSYSHPHLLEKDDARVLREMERTQAIIKKVTGRTPRYFRPPYGEVDERVARLAKAAGLATIQYDIASGDSDPGLSPQRIVRSVLRDAKGGSIIVFHVNNKGVHTAEVLPEVIKGLRIKELRPVAVGELLKETGSETPTTETRSQRERLEAGML
jgi:peptidoglycan/xylan/chitin deacetylase (PgdA/CDA1 family)